MENAKRKIISFWLTHVFLRRIGKRYPDFFKKWVYETTDNRIERKIMLKRYHAPAQMLNKFGKDNPKSKLVLQIKDGHIVAEFYGGKEAQRKTGIFQANISKCCNGERKTAGGYEWKYK